MPEPAGGTPQEGGEDILFGLGIDDRTGPVFEKFDKNIDAMQKKIDGIDTSNVTDNMVQGLKQGTQGAQGGLGSIFNDLLGGVMKGKGMPDMNSMLQGVAKGLGVVNPLLLTAVGAAVAAAAAFAKFAMECRKVTEVSETLGVTLEVLGNSAGYSNAQLKSYEEGMKKAGLTTIQARQALIATQQANVDLAKSSDLARIAQDAAVASGQSVDKTYQGLVNSIGNLNAKQLEQYGMTVNAQAEYIKYAQTIGKTAESLNKQEQQQALLNGVMREGKDIQGAYGDSLNTTQKIASEMPMKIQEIKRVIGEMAQPAVLEFMKFLNEKLQSLMEWVQKNEEFFKQLGLAIGNIVGFVLDFVEAIGKAVVFMVKLQTGLLLLPKDTNPFQFLADGLRAFNQICALANAEIAGLSAAFQAFIKGQDTTKAYMDAFNSSLWESNRAMGAYENTTDAVTESQEKLVDALVIANDMLRKFKEQADRQEADVAIQRQRRAIQQAMQEAWQLEDIERNHTERVTELLKDADKAKQKAVEQASRARLRVEEDYYRRLKEIQDNFEFEASELVRKRDAIGLMALARRTKRDLEKEKENYNYRKQDAARQFRETLADMDKATKEQLEKAEEARTKELENYARNLARQREMQALQDKWADQDRAKAYQRQLNDLIKQMAALDNITKAGLQQLLNDWQAYFNQLGIIGNVANAMNPAASTNTTQPGTMYYGRGRSTGANYGQAGQVSAELAYAITPAGLGNAAVLGRIPAAQPAGSSDRRDIHVTVDGNALDPYMQRVVVRTLLEVERNRGM